jgi:hypothetical protein
LTLCGSCTRPLEHRRGIALDGDGHGGEHEIRGEGETQTEACRAVVETAAELVEW